MTKLTMKVFTTYTFIRDREHFISFYFKFWHFLHPFLGSLNSSAILKYAKVGVFLFEMVSYNAYNSYDSNFVGWNLLYRAVLVDNTHDGVLLN